jgi:hypothetical protein
MQRRGVVTDGNRSLHAATSRSQPRHLSRAAAAASKLAQFLAVCRSSILAETLGYAASFSRGASRSVRINVNHLQMLIH